MRLAERSRMSRGSLVGARESKSSCDTSQASTLASMTADVEACILCRAAPPGDGDRCEANRKPVPDEPDEAAMVSLAASLMGGARCGLPSACGAPQIHRYRAPSIVARPLLEMGTAMTEICAHLKTACQKLFSVRISMFLCPLRADAPLRSWRRAAGKALQTLRAMPGRAPVAL